MTTNMQVLQTSILLKYKSLYEFLQNHAEDVAKEVERSYIIAARVYYETGFRRYIRSLGWIKVSYFFLTFCLIDEGRTGLVGIVD